MPTEWTLKDVTKFEITTVENLYTDKPKGFSMRAIHVETKGGETYCFNFHADRRIILETEAESFKRADELIKIESLRKRAEAEG